MSVWTLTWPLKVEGQKNGEMPKRGGRVTRVVWEERSAKRKEEKTKMKRVNDNNHMREKRVKENKIILNTWCDVVSVFYVAPDPMFSLCWMIVSVLIMKVICHCHWQLYAIVARYFHNRKNKYLSTLLSNNNNNKKNSWILNFKLEL